MTASVVTRRHVGRGLGWALLSAAGFGFSGPVGSAFLEAGWSPGLTTLIRIAGAAVLLLPVGIVLLRRHPPSAPDARRILLYGLAAVAGTQLCFFQALQHLSVGVALLLEFLAPVLLVGWTWARTRRTPGVVTLAGCVVSLAGLVLVVDPLGPQRVDAVGVAWGLASAVCVCVYFLLPGGGSDGDDGSDGVPAMLMLSAGTVVGAVVLVVTGLTGLTPWRTGAPAGTLGGVELGWPALLVLLVVLATVLPYVTGIVAIRHLDTRVASFVGLSEVLFGVLAAWLLIAQVPGPVQLLGGLLIVVGVILVRRADGRRPTVPAGMAAEG